jgi:hypothetical protein
VTLEVVAGPGAGFGVSDPKVSIDPGREAVVGEARLWLSYTGTEAGDTASGSITVRAHKTGQEWTAGVSANTIAREPEAVAAADE